MIPKFSASARRAMFHVKHSAAPVPLLDAAQ
jgi:hypothetical protein